MWKYNAFVNARPKPIVVDRRTVKPRQIMDKSQVKSMAEQYSEVFKGTLMFCFPLISVLNQTV